MFGNLANSDVIILAILIILILIVGITCIVLTIKGDGKKSKIAYEENSNTEPDIQMTLATEDIPDLAVEKLESTKNINLEEEIIDDIEIIYNDKQSESSMDLEIEDFGFDVHDSDKKDLDSKTKIEDVLKKMEEEIERQKYEVIDKYEEEQEENAVISYQELLDRKMALNDTANSDIKKTEIKVETITETIDENKPSRVWKDERQYERSEFISPIFGRQNRGSDQQTVKKTVETKEIKTTVTKASDETLDQTVDLLNTLKEYRRNI